MKKYHPDVNKDPRAQEIAKNINQAKETANQYLEYKKDNPGAPYDSFKRSYANTQNNTYHQQQKNPYQQIIERMHKNFEQHPYAKENSLKAEEVRKKFLEQKAIMDDRLSTPADKLKATLKALYYTGKITNQSFMQEAYFINKAATKLIPEWKEQGYSPQQIELKIKKMQNEARIRIENIKGNAHAAYAIPIFAYGASKDTTPLNSDYAYLDDQYFGGMEKIQSDEIQQSAQKEQIVNTIIDEVIAEELAQIHNISTPNNAAQEEFTTDSNVTSSLDKTNTDSTKNQINLPEQMQNIHNIAHAESIEQTQQIIEQDKTSHDQSENLVEQPSTWSDYLKSTSQSFTNSITDTTTAGIQLASDNPITTAAIVGGIAITVGTAAYYWYQNHYGKKPKNQDTTEKTN